MYKKLTLSCCLVFLLIQSIIYVNTPSQNNSDYIDHKTIIKAYGDGLHKTTLQLGLNFLNKYTYSPYLIDIIYLIYQIDKSNLQFKQYFNEQIATDLGSLELTKDDDYWKLALILLDFNKPDMAHDLMRQLAAESAAQQKFLEAEIDWLIQQDNCPELLSTINNIDPQIHAKLLLSKIDYSRQYCQLRQAKLAEAQQMLEIILNKALYTNQQKIMFLVLITKKAWENNQKELVEQYLKQARLLSNSGRQKLTVDLVEVELIFKESLNEKPIINSPDIKRALVLLDQNLSQNQPIAEANSLLQRGWLNYLSGNNSQSDQDWLLYQQKTGLNYNNKTLLLASLFQKQRQWTKANAIINAAIANAPDKEIPLLYQEKWRNDYENSDCPLILEEVKNSPWLQAEASPKIYLIIAKCYYQQQKYEQAVQNFKLVTPITIYNDLTYKEFLLSLIYTDNDQSLIMANNFLVNITQNQGFNILLAVNQELTERKNFNKIIRLHQLVDIKPWTIANQLSWKLQLAAAYYQNKQNKLADNLYLELFRQYAVEDDQQQEALKILHQWLANQDSFGQVKTYKEVWELNISQPLKEYIRLQLGFLYYQNFDDSQQARYWLQPLLTSLDFKQRPLVISIITESYIRDDNLPGALKFLEKELPSIDYASTAKPDLLLRYAQINQALDNIENAKSVYLRIINEYPNSETAENAESQLKQIAATM